MAPVLDPQRANNPLKALLGTHGNNASTAPATKLRNIPSNQSPLNCISSNLHDGKSVGISRPGLTSGCCNRALPRCTSDFSNHRNLRQPLSTSIASQLA
ncbi:Uncharacterized protein HZ326_9912 [Fusarium oxysporum f. sp. albedinis]|nr:Uncharacterized protein HZ326_9912 [Fusarium oxysporum f. sp. albedinis]